LDLGRRLTGPPTSGSKIVLRNVVLIRDTALLRGQRRARRKRRHIPSLVASARLHHLDSKAYLRDIIRLFSFSPRDRYFELAPRY
jgi:hypothetical protein